MGKERDRNKSTLFEYFLRGATWIFAALVIWGIAGYVSAREKVKGAKSCEDLPANAQEMFETFTGDRLWILLGEEISDDEKVVKLSLEVREQYRHVIHYAEDLVFTYQIANTEKAGTFTPDAESDLSYSAEVPVGDLAPGEYSVQAYADLGCGKISSPEYQFNVSHPLYVSWTLDWEGYDVKQQYLNDIDELTVKHNGIPITHFFNPRIFTTAGISKERQNYLANWVKEHRDNKGHAIGLHLHMFPDMVKAAGVTPRTGPAWGYSGSDGYDILVSAYSYEETRTILDWSKNIFIQEGLGEPTMFRAGGWFADGETLRALQDSGFVLDSSGRAAYQFGTNAVQGHWDLNSTTKPYRPSRYDQNSTALPTLKLWEFPNNGADSWAYSEEELIERFRDNYQGGPLAEKQIVTYLSHPEWFYKDKPKIDGLLTEIDKYLYLSDSGPVIYITLEDAYEIWSR